MTSQAMVNEFVSQPTLAIVGVSRSGKKFGYTILQEMKGRGYRMFPIHPQAENINGEKCYPDFASLPEKVGGVIIVVPPTQAISVVQQAHKAGIERIWLQQGAESQEAVQYCEENGIQVIAGECILMLAKDTKSFHNFHRIIWGWLGKLPK